MSCDAAWTNHLPSKGIKMAPMGYRAMKTMVMMTPCAKMIVLSSDDEPPLLTAPLPPLPPPLLPPLSPMLEGARKGFSSLEMDAWARLTWKTVLSS